MKAPLLSTLIRYSGGQSPQGFRGFDRCEGNSLRNLYLLQDV